ncbi:hypothetical protein WJX84_005568 [Apatococcus fuscideae]|uniref:Spen paralogue and orthologue SPOC C-terminal domain-containing protein n=1 Tax=Apatococcus fuscideae TaxID=2026836 RepID=A0AAW1TAL8_9CHLO
MLQEQTLKSAPESKPNGTGPNLGTFDNFLGATGRGLGVGSAWGDPFEAVAGGSDGAPSDQQPDHYLRDEPMEDAESAPSPEEPAEPARASIQDAWDLPTQVSHLDPLLIPPPADLTEQGWQGIMALPDMGSLELEAVMLAGASDVTALIPLRPSPDLRWVAALQLEPKGRLPLSKLEECFVDLRRSRSRTVSLGFLRASPSLSPSRAAHFDQVPAFYAARDRAAVLEQADRAEETYLLPPCALATRLLATAKSASASAAAAGPIPAEVPPGTMLLAVVHRKDVVLARKPVFKLEGSSAPLAAATKTEAQAANPVAPATAAPEPEASALKVEAAVSAAPEQPDMAVSQVESTAPPELVGLDSLFQSIMGASLGGSQPIHADGRMDFGAAASQAIGSSYQYGQVNPQQQHWQGVLADPSFSAGPAPHAPQLALPGYAPQPAAGFQQQPFAPFASQHLHGATPPPPPQHAPDPGAYQGMAGPNHAFPSQFQTIQSPYPLQAHVQAPSQPQSQPPPMQFVPQNDAPGMQPHGQPGYRGSFRSPRGGGYRGRSNPRGSGPGRGGQMPPQRGPY